MSWDKKLLEKKWDQHCHFCCHYGNFSKVIFAQMGPIALKTNCKHSEHVCIAFYTLLPYFFYLRKTCSRYHLLPYLLPYVLPQRLLLAYCYIMVGTINAKCNSLYVYPWVMFCRELWVALGTFEDFEELWELLRTLGNFGNFGNF